MSFAMRFANQDQAGYANRLLSMMRNAFGGHAVTSWPFAGKRRAVLSIPIRARLAGEAARA
mgnify:CR=1 FL=1